MVILLFFNVFHPKLQTTNPVALTTNKSTTLQKGLTTANGQGRERSKKFRGVKSERPCRRKTSLTTAGTLSFHCVPHQMPIHGASGCWEAGERHPPTQSWGLCCVAHREEREGESRCEKRCKGRNYEFSASKVQVLIEVCVAVGLHCPFFMTNPSLT